MRTIDASDAPEDVPRCVKIPAHAYRTCRLVQALASAAMK
jgi:hypothetical protein